MIKSHHLSNKQRSDGKVNLFNVLSDIKNDFHFVFYCFPWELSFIKTKTDTDFVSMDDSQRVSWLLTYKTVKFVRLLQKPWETRTTIYQDKLQQFFPVNS